MPWARTSKPRAAASRRPGTPSSKTPSSSISSTPSMTISSASSATWGSFPPHNLFEGIHTTRIYNLLAHGPTFEQVPVHPAILPICEGVLDPGLLVSSLSSIAIGPDESPQPIHADDQVIPLPKPHPPTVCNTMWALTEFTESNGATRIIPGTHTADPITRPHTELRLHSCGDGQGQRAGLARQPVARRRGEHDRDRRVGIAMNYCAGYIRQQENQQLGLPSTWSATSRRGCRNWSATGSIPASSATSTRRCRPMLSSVPTRTPTCSGTTPPLRRASETWRSATGDSTATRRLGHEPGPERDR